MKKETNLSERPDLLWSISGTCIYNQKGNLSGTCIYNMYMHFCCLKFKGTVDVGEKSWDMYIQPCHD